MTEQQSLECLSAIGANAAADVVDSANSADEAKEKTNEKQPMTNDDSGKPESIFNGKGQPQLSSMCAQALEQFSAAQHEDLRLRPTFYKTCKTDLAEHFLNLVNAAPRVLEPVDVAETKPQLPQHTRRQRPVQKVFTTSTTTTTTAIGKQ